MTGDPLELTTLVPCVLPLQHLSSAKIVISLLNKRLPSKSFYDSKVLETDDILRIALNKKFKIIKRQVTGDIRNFIPHASGRTDLENFIAPLFGEFASWLRACRRICLLNDDSFLAIVDSIPHCWLSDGTIDREKSALAVVENSNLLLTNRFIFACTFCFYEHILYVWELLSETEKTQLRHLRQEAFAWADASVVDEWIAWLESWLNKEWPHCVAWILGTSLWNKNECVVRRVLLELTPAERIRYSLNCVIGTQVSSDVVRFCLSIIGREEQELIFRESPAEVFKCMLSWPLKSVFFDVANSCSPYLTGYTFTSVLHMLSDKVTYPDPNDPTAEWGLGIFEHIEIMQYLWTKRPFCFRDTSKDDPQFSRVVQMLLTLDLKSEYEMERLFKIIGTSNDPRWDNLFEYPGYIEIPRPIIFPEIRFTSRRRGVFERFMSFFRYISSWI